MTLLEKLLGLVRRRRELSRELEAHPAQTELKRNGDTQDELRERLAYSIARGINNRLGPWTLSAEAFRGAPDGMRAPYLLAADQVYLELYMEVVQDERREASS